MKKKLISLILATLTVLALCAGCGPATPPAPPVPTYASGAPAMTAPVFVDGVAGNDENTGDAPDAAIATYEKAYSLVTAERNLIVIVNTVTTAAIYSMPESEIPVYITSTYNEVDYAATNGAVFSLSRVSLCGDTYFTAVKIMPIAPTSALCLQFHNVGFDETVVTDKNGVYPTLIGGYHVTDVAMNVANHMTAAEVGAERDCTLGIFGGTWNSFTGGNNRVERNSPVGTFTGNETVNVGGTASFVSTGKSDDLYANVFCAGGSNFYVGSLTLNVYGGVFNCPVYGLSRLGTYYNKTSANGKTGTDGLAYGKAVSFHCDIAVNIFGGDFTAANADVINALQYPGDTAVTGTYTLTVKEAVLPDITFSALGIIGTASADGLDETQSAAAANFDMINGKETGAAHEIRIACVGDSITWGTASADAMKDAYVYKAQNNTYPAKLQELYGETAVVGNFGYPGSNLTASSYADYYKSCAYGMCMAFQPDIIIFALGTNNAANMPGSETAVSNEYKRMLKDLHEAFPEARLVVTTALYRFDKTERTTQVENYIIPMQKKIVEDVDYTELLDLYTFFRPYGNTNYYKDKLHPNNAGYEKMAECVFNNLKIGE